MRKNLKRFLSDDDLSMDSFRKKPEKHEEAFEIILKSLNNDINHRNPLVKELIENRDKTIEENYRCKILSMLMKNPILSRDI